MKVRNCARSQLTNTHFIWTANVIATINVVFAAQEKVTILVLVNRIESVAMIIVRQGIITRNQPESIEARAGADLNLGHLLGVAASIALAPRLSLYLQNILSPNICSSLNNLRGTEQISYTVIKDITPLDRDLIAQIAPHHAPVDRKSQIDLIMLALTSIHRHLICNLSINADAIQAMILLQLTVGQVTSSNALSRHF